MARRVFVFVWLLLLPYLLPNAKSQILGDYLNGIKDAMSSVRSYLNTGLEGLTKLAKALETVEQFVDANIEEDCDPFICPPGTVRVQNRHHVPSSNGCGSFGFEWKEDALPHKELKECCNEHDYCYDQCGSDKDLCDLYFKKCLYKVCARKEQEFSLLQVKACKGTAKIMYTGTLAMGCKAYRDAQEKACYCLRREEF